jgi:hypothetical protein
VYLGIDRAYIPINICIYAVICEKNNKKVLLFIFISELANGNAEIPDKGTNMAAKAYGPSSCFA